MARVSWDTQRPRPEIRLQSAPFSDHPNDHGNNHGHGAKKEATVRV